jgi:Helix-turn-helix domain
MLRGGKEFQVRKQDTSPATVLLGAAGYRQIELAELVGRSVPTVCKVMRGQRRRSPEFDLALIRLIGKEPAAQVLAAIPVRETHVK